MANTARISLELTPRHLWLALLGTAGLARRQFVAGLCTTRTRAVRLAGSVRTGGTDARDIARGAWMTMQETLANEPRRRARRAR